MHKASVVGTISERNHILKDASSSSKEKKDTNVVWCKDCVVTCVLDCDQHTFSIEVDGKLVKDAVVKNLPSGVKFFPLISTCPAPEEEEDENDDMDDTDAEILELKKKTKASFPLISIVREKKKEVVETKEVSKEEEEEIEKKPATPPKEVFGWQWKRTDKTRWHFFEEEVEKDIENEYVVFERWCSSVGLRALVFKCEAREC